MSLWRKLIFIVLILFAPVLYASSAQLTAVRLSNARNNAQIIFEFNKHFNYHLLELTKPQRLVISFPNAHLRTSLSKLSLAGTPIHSVRHVGKKNGTLQIILGIRKPVKTKIVLLKPSGPYHYRLLVDLSKRTTSLRVSEINQKHVGRSIIVVIDPGHGGKDPGATGSRGTHEKNIVLAISKKLQKDINKIVGMKAILTRKGDYYLTLRQRLRLARRYQADFFVAIHADAFHTRSASGASVFALSERGATSEAAHWLAEKENYSELGGVFLADKSRLLRSVLLDLSQTATITSSLKMGKNVIHQLHQLTTLHSNKVEQARFVVLKSPDIPSLLVETGFISNPYEEKRLNTSWYQEKLAQSIMLGVKKYFWRFPPPNSLFALERNEKKHRVKKGDTLAMLAKRYKTKAVIIKKLNRMHSNHLRVGQQINIPG